MDKVQKFLESMENSPLFDLSLGSNEEFHSLFIVWFLNFDIEKHINLFFDKKHAKEVNGHYKAVTSDSMKDGFFDVKIVDENQEAKFVIEFEKTSIKGYGELRKVLEKSLIQKIKNEDKKILQKKLIEDYFYYINKIYEPIVKNESNIKVQSKSLYRCIMGRFLKDKCLKIVKILKASHQY